MARIILEVGFWLDHDELMMADSGGSTSKAEFIAIKHLHFLFHSDLFKNLL